MYIYTDGECTLFGMLSDPLNLCFALNTRTITSWNINGYTSIAPRIAGEKKKIKIMGYSKWLYTSINRAGHDGNDGYDGKEGYIHRLCRTILKSYNLIEYVKVEK